jgi:glycosyltransferase involved in cell wall biosynthesis
MRVLFIADVKNWCFDKIGQMLTKYGTHNYSMRYKGDDKYKSAFKGMDHFDLIIYAVDVRPDHIMKYSPPRDKTIMLIRSDVFKLCSKGRNKFYKNAQTANTRVSAFMIANEYLYNKFKSIHNVSCYLAPGGVDTNLFKRRHYKSYRQMPAVGWSGSLKYFGPKVRGTDLVEQACLDLGMEYNPAIKEETWRTPEEMAEYYNKEIDIYVDASSTAGRQNGLLEAAACGLTCLCTEVGIGKELIDAGVAIKIDRNLDSIKVRLIEALEHSPKPDYIKKHWSWETHVKEWERIFERVKRGA